MTINQIVRIENGIAFILIFFIYMFLDFPTWMFFVFLLAPDITAIGYVFNKNIGSKIYNFGHNLVLPLLLALFYLYLSIDYLLIVAIIWSAHIFMDRLLGYGLKYKDSFNKTHIQKI